jgi:hypothetical protein
MRWDVVKFALVAECEAPQRDINSFHATFSLDGKAILSRHFDHGPAWVCDDEDDSEHYFDVRNARWADHEFAVIWTAVPYDTAASAHPHYFDPHQYEDWVKHLTDYGPLRIWLPAERRSSALEAVAGTKSRLVIGGVSGAMTMISLFE